MSCPRAPSKAHKQEHNRGSHDSGGSFDFRDMVYNYYAGLSPVSRSPISLPPTPPLRSGSSAASPRQWADLQQFQPWEQPSWGFRGLARPILPQAQDITPSTSPRISRQGRTISQSEMTRRASRQQKENTAYDVRKTESLRPQSRDVRGSETELRDSAASSSSDDNNKHLSLERNLDEDCRDVQYRWLFGDGSPIRRRPIAGHKSRTARKSSSQSPFQTPSKATKSTSSTSVPPGSDPTHPAESQGIPSAQHLVKGKLALKKAYDRASSPSTTAESTSAPPDPTTTRTCVSCTDELPSNDFSSLRLTQSCSHENGACKDCVKQWIETRLEDGGWDEIKCLECAEVMQYSDVHQHADPQLFQRYDALAASSWLNNEEDFVWCRSQGCGSGQVHEGGKNMPLFQCIACSSRYCIVHEEPWHEGETCAAFDRRMNGEQPVDEGEPFDRDATERFADIQLLLPPSPPRKHGHQRIDRGSTERFVDIELPLPLPSRNHGHPRTRTISDISSLSNDGVERRLHDQRKARRTTTTDDQLELDFDTALALQYADEEGLDHASRNSNAWRQQPHSGSTRSNSNPWRQGLYRDYAKSTPRGYRSPFDASQAADPPPMQAHMNRKSFVRKFINHKSGSGSDQNDHVPQYHRHYSAPFTPDKGSVNDLRQTRDDAVYARNLQNQYESDERDRRSAAEQQMKYQRSVQEANDRATRRQTAKDAATARALSDKFALEERERVRKVQEQRERQAQEQQRKDRDRRDREAYQRRKAEETLGEQTVKSNAKQCPKCRWYIQKTAGCDHMTCWKCKYEFCWLCLADYQGIRDHGNSRHNSYCRDYR